MSRSDHRRGMTDETRLRLLENDVDELDETASRLAGGIESVRKVLVGILVSLATASFLLALNLAFGIAGA